MAFEAAILADRSIIEISGAPASNFLNGLVTVDLADVAHGSARHGALLTPQGKILYEFCIFHGGPESLLLDVSAEFAEELVKRLTFYKLRAKLEIGIRDDLSVAVLWGDPGAAAIAGAAPDPRHGEMGWRALLPRNDAVTMLEAAGARLTTTEAYETRRIALGIAETGRDYASGEVFPHEADLDQLSGVDFDKGCFVGQEVVSRMQHRGTARKRFVPVAMEGTAEPGNEVRAGDSTLGIMGSSADGHGLALIRLDRLGEALSAGEPIEAGEARLTPRKPDWARFEWPDSTA